MNIQNDLKSVPNNIKSVNTFENLQTKIFRDFRLFEYPLYRKRKTGKCRESTESLRNKKPLSVNSYRYWKTAKKQRIYYLSAIFASITSKTGFKLQR